MSLLMKEPATRQSPRKIELCSLVLKKLDPAWVMD